MGGVASQSGRPHQLTYAVLYRARTRGRPPAVSAAPAPFCGQTACAATEAIAHQRLSGQELERPPKKTTPLRIPAKTPDRCYPVNRRPTARPKCRLTG